MPSNASRFRRHSRSDVRRQRGSVLSRLDLRTVAPDRDADSPAHEIADHIDAVDAPTRSRIECEGRTLIAGVAQPPCHVDQQHPDAEDGDAHMRLPKQTVAQEHQECGDQLRMPKAALVDPTPRDRGAGRSSDADEEPELERDLSSTWRRRDGTWSGDGQESEGRHSV